MHEGNDFVTAQIEQLLRRLALKSPEHQNREVRALLDGSLGWMDKALAKPAELGGYSVELRDDGILAKLIGNAA